MRFILRILFAVLVANSLLSTTGYLLAEDGQLPDKEVFFERLTILEWGECILTDETLEGIRFKDKLVYKAIYKMVRVLVDKEADFYESTPVLKEINIYDSHPGARERIFVDELNIIRNRYVFRLDNNIKYSRLDYADQYSNGVLLQRDYYDQFNRISKTEQYTVDSAFKGLEGKEDFYYDITYGGVRRTVTGADGNITEIERSDSNGNLLDAYRYYYDKYGNKMVDVISAEGLRIATQLRDPMTGVIKKTTFYNQDGVKSGYRLYEYNEKGKKGRVLTFSSDGSQVDIMFYNAFGRLTSREIYRNGKLLNSVKY